MCRRRQSHHLHPPLAECCSRTAVTAPLGLSRVAGGRESWGAVAVKVGPNNQLACGRALAPCCCHVWLPLALLQSKPSRRPPHTTAQAATAMSTEPGVHSLLGIPDTMVSFQATRPLPSGNGRAWREQRWRHVRRATVRGCPRSFASGCAQLQPHHSADVTACPLAAQAGGVLRRRRRINAWAHSAAGTLTANTHA